MRGQQYTASFEPTPIPEYPEDIAGTNESVGLEFLLHGLYGPTSEVYFLGDLPSPHIVEVARHIIDSNRIRSNTVAQLNRNFTAALAAGDLGMLHIEEETPVTDRSDLARAVEQETQEIAAVAIAFSTGLLSKSLAKIASKAQIPDNKRRAATATAVVEAIGETRKQIHEDLSPYSGIITIHSDYYDRKLLKTSIEVTHRNALTPIPSWLLQSTKKDESVHRLCAAIAEQDILVGLLEWVQARKLPYIPIYSPDSFEDGKQIVDRKNLHSDIVLCSLIDDTVIPIQSKGSHHRMHRSLYDEEIVIISPQDIDCVTSTAAIVKTRSGAMRTGWRSSTTYGTLLTAWINTYARGKKPAHHSKMRLHEAMQPAFACFDKNILPLITG